MRNSEALEREEDAWTTRAPSNSWKRLHLSSNGAFFTFSVDVCSPAAAWPCNYLHQRLGDKNKRGRGECGQDCTQVWIHKHGSGMCGPNTDQQQTLFASLHYWSLMWNLLMPLFVSQTYCATNKCGHITGRAQSVVSNLEDLCLV